MPLSVLLLYVVLRRIPFEWQRPNSNGAIYSRDYVACLQFYFGEGSSIATCTAVSLLAILSFGGASSIAITCKEQYIVSSKDSTFKMDSRVYIEIRVQNVYRRYETRSLPFSNILLIRRRFHCVLQIYCVLRTVRVPIETCKTDSLLAIRWLGDNSSIVTYQTGALVALLLCAIGDALRMATCKTHSL